MKLLKNMALFHRNHNLCHQVTRNQVVVTMKMEVRYLFEFIIILSSCSRCLFNKKNKHKVQFSFFIVNYNSNNVSEYSSGGLLQFIYNINYREFSICMMFNSI